MSAATSGWMIYGANGYTGELVAEEAVRRGWRPVLAGRRADVVAPLAARLGLEHRVFALSSGAEVARHMGGMKALLLCAGPFSQTSAPAVEGCLAAGAHYLDITGEISVFEACHARGPDAERAGCVILPGVGFDVVPTDCLAASLKAALPGATELSLAFHGAGSPSKGTAKTMLEGLPKGGAVRRGGVLTEVPLAWKTAEIPFHDKPRTAVTIPWGDVSTAFYSTGIPDIEVYMAQPAKMIRAIKLARPFRRLFGLSAVQRFASRRIDAKVHGPDRATRESTRSELWGRVRDPSGGQVEGTLTTPEGYQLTVLSSLASVDRLLSGGVPPGAHTPSTAFGADFVATIDGCTLRVPARAAS